MEYTQAPPATAPFTNAELESAVKVVWVGNPPVPGQSCKVGEHNKEQKNDFEDTEGIEMDTPLEQRRVQQGGECDAGNRDTTCLPPVLRGWVVSVEDVTPERERVSGRTICESSTEVVSGLRWPGGYVVRFIYVAKTKNLSDSTIFGLIPRDGDPRLLPTIVAESELPA